ncbi:MAG: ABC transporter substrate-binding protein, partial [Pseudomonadota bacterium]
MLRGFLLAAAGCLGATMALAQTAMPFALDWKFEGPAAPYTIAVDEGFFAEAGLEVEVIAPTDPSAPPKLVAAGQGDIAVSYQVQLHIQVGEGLPLAWAGTLVATPLNCLLTLEDGPIDSPADLKGKTIGYSVAGVEEAILGAILEKHGVALDEVTLVNVNFSLSPALMTGRVDAVIGAYR